MDFIDYSGNAIAPSTIKDGDIVSFCWHNADTGRIKWGYAWMKDADEFYAAYNLYRDADDESGVWVSDSMPSGVTFYSPTKENFLFALDKMMGMTIVEAPLNIPAHFWGEDSTCGFKSVITDMQNREDAYLHIIERCRKLIKESDDRNCEIVIANIVELKNLQSKLDEAQARINKLEENIEDLKRKPTEAAFVKKFVKETKHFYKHDRKKADAIRQIMIKVGQSEAEADLDAWMEGNEKSAEVHNHFEAGSSNQVFNGNVNGDF